MIRESLQESGDKYWGFVVYRCTYEDDAAWAEFMRILNARALESLQCWEAEDLMESLNWKVHEGKALLDGASKEFVREQFKSWVASRPSDESCQPDTVWEPGLGPRLTYCIHVDKNALHSVVTSAPKPPHRDWDGIGNVNFINATWTPPDPADFDAEEAGYDDPWDDGVEPIEGSRLYTFGWMKLCVQTLVTEMYFRMGFMPDWDLLYVRPPDVATPGMNTHGSVTGEPAANIG